MVHRHGHVVLCVLVSTLVLWNMAIFPLVVIIRVLVQV